MPTEVLPGMQEPFAELPNGQQLPPEIERPAMILAEIAKGLFGAKRDSVMEQAINLERERFVDSVSHLPREDQVRRVQERAATLVPQSDDSVSNTTAQDSNPPTSEVTAEQEPSPIKRSKARALLEKFANSTFRDIEEAAFMLAMIAMRLFGEDRKTDVERAQVQREISSKKLVHLVDAQKDGKVAIMQMGGAVLQAGCTFATAAPGITGAAVSLLPFPNTISAEAIAQAADGGAKMLKGPETVLDGRSKAWQSESQKMLQDAQSEGAAMKKEEEQLEQRARTLEQQQQQREGGRNGAFSQIAQAS